MVASRGNVAVFSTAIICESIDRGNDVIIVQYVILFLSLAISQAAQARCINYPVFRHCFAY